MDDLTDGERKRSRAMDLLNQYSESVVMLLAEEIIRYEEEFNETTNPLDGTAPALLEKYYGVLNSIATASKALGSAGRVTMEIMHG
jgi:hypothetical protein